MEGFYTPFDLKLLTGKSAETIRYHCRRLGIPLRSAGRYLLTAAEAENVLRRLGSRTLPKP